MKEISITIRTYNRERRAEQEHPVKAYADERYPGLAIHGPWALGENDWRVTHVPSGLAIAVLPTRAAATAALPIIAKLQDWNRPLPEVAAHGEPGQQRWLTSAPAESSRRQSLRPIRGSCFPAVCGPTARSYPRRPFRAGNMRCAARPPDNPPRPFDRSRTMIEPAELSVDTLVLEALPRTRTIGEAAFWEKYSRLCDKHRIMALPGQVKSALRRLKQEGKIIVTREGARKL